MVFDLFFIAWQWKRSEVCNELTRCRTLPTHLIANILPTHSKIITVRWKAFPTGVEKCSMHFWLISYAGFLQTGSHTDNASHGNGYKTSCFFLILPSSRQLQYVKSKIPMLYFQHYPWWQVIWSYVKWGMGSFFAMITQILAKSTLSKIFIFL